MTTYYKDSYQNLPEEFNAPYGNVLALNFHFETDASGIMADSNKATAVAATDVIVLGKLKAGDLPLFAFSKISSAFATSSTFDLGYLYVDGEDVTAAPQDADGFFDALAADSAVASSQVKAVAPTRLTKDAYVVLTNNTAAQDGVGVADFILLVDRQG